jgi:hypothetical protein
MEALSRHHSGWASANVGLEWGLQRGFLADGGVMDLFVDHLQAKHASLPDPAQVPSWHDFSVCLHPGALIYIVLCALLANDHLRRGAHACAMTSAVPWIRSG